MYRHMPCTCTCFHTIRSRPNLISTDLYPQHAFYLSFSQFDEAMTSVCMVVGRRDGPGRARSASMMMAVRHHFTSGSNHKRDYYACDGAISLKEVTLQSDVKAMHSEPSELSALRMMAICQVASMPRQRADLDTYWPGRPLCPCGILSGGPGSGSSFPPRKGNEA